MKEKIVEEEEGDPAQAEETTTPAEGGVPVLPAANTLVDDANKAAARLEKANKEKEALISREEALRVQETLGGKAKQAVKEKVSDSDYANKVMAGEMNDESKR